MVPALLLNLHYKFGQWYIDKNKSQGKNTCRRKYDIFKIEISK